MNDKLLEKVNLWADKYGVLKADSCVVVGVSGGADSVCLLHILYKLCKARTFSIAAVHINHMLRGAESDGDEHFVRDLCTEYNIPLNVFNEDVAAFARESNYSIEEAGRLIRYKRFREVLDKTHATHIAVAHHRDDQAETIFLNLLRGTGIDGLCGMPGIKDKIIRPLLDVSKNEIEAYIKRNCLSYRTDSSNYENNYLRNAVRNVIFPEIKQQTGTDIASSLLRAQRLLKTDRDFLNQYTDEKFKTVLISEEKAKVVLKRNELLELHPAIASRIMRIAWEKVTGSLKGLESSHVNSVLSIAAKKGNKTVELPKGITATSEYDKLVISSQVRKDRIEPFSFSLSLPSVVDLPVIKLKVEARLFSRDEFIKHFGKINKPKENSFTQLFDYGRIKKGIYIRNRLPGDTFFPFNSSGRKKLKDFFIDEKIPNNIRGNIPLLTEDKNIIWVIGFRTSEEYKITELTETILYVNVLTHEN